MSNLHSSYTTKVLCHNKAATWLKMCKGWYRAFLDKNCNFSQKPSSYEYFNFIYVLLFPFSLASSVQLFLTASKCEKCSCYDSLCYSDIYGHLNFKSDSVLQYTNNFFKSLHSSE